ncbi:hypothetical protein MTR_1g041880 [Medicago truncatula]|uniref:Uncharacterized protein n=1 Tax=Medicago truncatula TaxID=3880 RepID=G7I3P6_MEDTR|nr:hypothetical protein MTR_1g041880 [Medicago truncatula]
MVLPVFDFKEGTKSPWKSTKEAPRLSLDRKAVVDAKGTMKIHLKEEEKRRCSTSTSHKKDNGGGGDGKTVLFWPNEAESDGGDGRKGWRWISFHEGRRRGLISMRKNK